MITDPLLSLSDGDDTYTQNKVHYTMISIVSSIWAVPVSYIYIEFRNSAAIFSGIKIIQLKMKLTQMLHLNLSTCLLFCPIRVFACNFIVFLASDYSHVIHTEQMNKSSH